MDIFGQQVHLNRRQALSGLGRGLLGLGALGATGASLSACTSSQLNDQPEAKKSTRFYQSIEGTAYAAYAAENKFLRDNQYFIKKKTRDAEYQFTMIYYDYLIGVWRDYRNGCYVISEDVDKQCRLVYATTTETQEPNTMLLRGFKSSVHLSNLKKAYDMGCVYYENQKLHNWFRDIVRMGL